MTKLSIIIPAYNEEGRITETLLDVSKTLSLYPFYYEIIVVDDGSTDGTAQVVKTLAEKIPQLSLLSGKDNHGKGWAVKEGMLSATGDIRLFMDADNSTKVEEMFRMLPYFEQGFDVVVGSRHIAGSRIAVPQPRLRIFLGKVLRIIVHALIPISVVDSQCGFKAFTAKAAETIFPKETIFRWAFDVEILLLAKKYNLRIQEVPVTWANNSDTRVSFFGKAKMLLEIIQIRVRM